MIMPVTHSNLTIEVKSYGLSIHAVNPPMSVIGHSHVRFCILQVLVSSGALAEQVLNNIYL